MKTHLDCYACFLGQALSAMRMAGAADPVQEAVMAEVLGLLQDADLSGPPGRVSMRMHRLVRERLGGVDPYLDAKRSSTRQALELAPRLTALVAEADDPLDTALRLSIAGNIIDFGIGGNHRFDLWKTVERVLIQPFAIDDRAAFMDALASVEWVLYLGDNAGETVFDRVLIRQLGAPVTYAVRGGPILNDATIDDALEAGLGDVARLVDNGAAAAGTILDLCSTEFQDLFESASLIIAKGQGNYETLHDAGPRVFSLLQIKCPVVAQDLGHPIGSLVLRQATLKQTGGVI